MNEIKDFYRNEIQTMLDEHNARMDKRIEDHLQMLRERFLSNSSQQSTTKKKKIKQDEQDKENTRLNDNTVTSDASVSERSADADAMPPPPPLRPVRTAKIAASKNLKEPDLSHKMRQPVQGQTESSMPKIKEEPVEIAEEVVVKRETRSKKVKKEKPSIVPETREEMSKQLDVPGDKRSASVELIPAAQPETVEVPSDDETDKMPPPTMAAPKTRRPRTKKKTPASSTATSGALIRESGIKQEMLKNSQETDSCRASGESQYEDAVTGESNPINNATHVIPKEMPTPNEILANATFEIETKTSNEEAHDSLMTEDNSIELPEPEPEAEAEPVEKELPPPKKVAPQKKKKADPHELFNPCVQSPLRAKVEAFERHAAASVFSATTTAPVTSGLRSQASRAMLGTPSQPVPVITLTKASSTTKLCSNTGAKEKSTAAPMSATKTLTRSHSAEDTKKGLNVLQQLAEEKRKKREERHKLAQMAREAREREKEEKRRRMLLEQQEREEKIRAERLKALKAKRAQEQEQKMKLDELQKKQMTRKVEMGKVKSIKYGFDMLCSDDSTDEEGKSSDKRPPPPLWSMKPRRQEFGQIQDYLFTEIEDKLFMVQPRTPNLQEIFPDIDPRNLHRNSSAVWRTPPRYSQIPK
ncbi:hypothetical protein DMENIID0001_165020 [Sergentomyia squamirostris]